MLYNAVFLEVMLNYRKCCENMTRRHWVESLLRQFTSTGFNKDFQKQHIEKAANITKTRERGRGKQGRESELYPGKNQDRLLKSFRTCLACLCVKLDPSLICNSSR